MPLVLIHTGIVKYLWQILILYSIQFAYPTYSGSPFSDEIAIMIRHYVIHPYLKICYYVMHPTKYFVVERYSHVPPPSLLITCFSYNASSQFSNDKCVYLCQLILLGETVEQQFKRYGTEWKDLPDEQKQNYKVTSDKTKSERVKDKQTIWNDHMEYVCSEVSAWFMKHTYSSLMFFLVAETFSFFFMNWILQLIKTCMC